MDSENEEDVVFNINAYEEIDIDGFSVSSMFHILDEIERQFIKFETCSETLRHRRLNIACQIAEQEIQSLDHGSIDVSEDVKARFIANLLNLEWRLSALTMKLLFPDPEMCEKERKKSIENSIYEVRNNCIHPIRIAAFEFMVVSDALIHPLTNQQQIVFDIILRESKENRGIKGPQILDEYSRLTGQVMEQGTLTSRTVMQVLKERRKVKNKRGFGYYVEGVLTLDD